MLFGTKTEFAIEAAVEPGLEPPAAVYGRMQVWCANTPIGDFTAPYCSLYGAYLGFKALRASFPVLWRNELDGLSDVALIDRLDSLLYGARGEVSLDDDRTLADCKRDWDTYSGFGFLTNWGEQFDSAGKAFVFCPTGEQVKVLLRPQGTDEVVSLHSRVSTVSSAIDEFLDWFDDTAIRLSGKA